MTRKAYDDTVLPNLDVTSNRRGLNDAACANMNMVSNLHRVVIEGSAIGLVRGSVMRKIAFVGGETRRVVSRVCKVLQMSRRGHIPDNTIIPNQTISTEGYHDGMSRSCSSQVSANDGTA